MMNPLRTRKMDREKLNSLNELQRIREAEKEKSANTRIETLIFQKFDEIGLGERIGEISSRLDEIANRMDELVGLYQSNCRQKTSPSARKLRVKDMVALLLQQHGSLSAPQLCRMLNLSRTRCSEYLKEMENAGVLASELNCRKRFYKIRQ